MRQALPADEGSPLTLSLTLSIAKTLSNVALMYVYSSTGSVCRFVCRQYCPQYA